MCGGGWCISWEGDASVVLVGGSDFCREVGWREDDVSLFVWVEVVWKIHK